MLRIRLGSKNGVRTAIPAALEGVNPVVVRRALLPRQLILKGVLVILIASCAILAFVRLVLNAFRVIARLRMFLPAPLFLRIPMSASPVHLRPCGVML
jgi:hypothetical protein